MFLSSPLFGGRRPIGRASSFSDGWGGSKRPPTSKLFLPPKKISRSQASKALLMSRAEPHFGQAHRHLKEVRGVGWHASLSERMKLGNLKPSGWRFSRSCFTFLLKFHFDVVGFHCMKWHLESNNISATHLLSAKFIFILDSSPTLWIAWKPHQSFSFGIGHVPVQFKSLCKKVRPSSTNPQTKHLKSTTLHMGVSKNRGTPKWMVYNGKPF